MCSLHSFLVRKSPVRSIVRFFSSIPYSATMAPKQCNVIIHNSICKKSFSSDRERICEDSPPTTVMRLEFPEKVRLGFIPDNWFQFVLPKTGRTGLYTFGIGFITFLLSKEIYVLEHEYYSGLSLAILIILTVKKLGPALATYADKEIDQIQQRWADMHKADIKQVEKYIEMERKEQWRAEGALMLMKAKREMIDMQLESAYREKIMQLYRHILNCLEYQIACANVERRVSYKSFMLWIHKEVLNSLSKTDEKNMEKTKADVSAMCIRLKDLEKEEEIRSKIK